LAATCAQIAVLRETEGQGPFCSLVLAVVVVKDVVVFVAFATNLEVASAVRAVEGDEASKPLLPLQDFVKCGARRSPPTWRSPAAVRAILDGLDGCGRPGQAMAG